VDRLRSTLEQLSRHEHEDEESAAWLDAVMKAASEAVTSFANNSNQLSFDFLH
jgi:hypothetical protein